VTGVTSRPQGDRVALVTGAGRGIGRAIAVRLAADGVRVMAVARTADELSELAAETGGEWLADTVATAGGCERIVEETERRYGRIDVLVNNAGIGSVGEQLTWLQDPARWHEAMAVNLHAPFELARLTLPGMIDRGFGRIVMIASLASLAAGVAPGMSAYATSKHGLLGLTRAVALEVAAHGVTCNAVLPGSVRTRTSELKVAEEAERSGSTVEEAWQAREARTVAGRLVRAEEIAAVVAFLASEEASAVNGETIGVALQAYG
jgi:3-hydroxybutyrate dehydrogenase